jgi:hypothetical protein
MAIRNTIKKIKVPSMSAMDLLYPRNLKNISNWRKSEYLLVMYDAENEQKKIRIAVSTHPRQKNKHWHSFFVEYPCHLFYRHWCQQITEHPCHYFYLVIATNFWMRIWINILTTSWAVKHFIFHFHFS